MVVSLRSVYPTALALWRRAPVLGEQQGYCTEVYRQCLSIVLLWTPSSSVQRLPVERGRNAPAEPPLSCERCGDSQLGCDGSLGRGIWPGLFVLLFTGAFCEFLLAPRCLFRPTTGGIARLPGVKYDAAVQSSPLRLSVAHSAKQVTAATLVHRIFSLNDIPTFTPGSKYYENTIDIQPYSEISVKLSRLTTNKTFFDLKIEHYIVKLRAMLKSLKLVFTSFFAEPSRYLYP